MWASLRLPATIVGTCFDKNAIWVQHNASAGAS